MREVALHGGAIAAALRDEPLRPWLAASLAGDVTDIVWTYLGRAEVPDGAPAQDRARGRRLGAADARRRRAGRRVSELAYERSGSGPPLVLLHPLGADRAVGRRSPSGSRASAR